MRARTRGHTAVGARAVAAGAVFVVVPAAALLAACLLAPGFGSGGVAAPFPRSPGEVERLAAGGVALAALALAAWWLLAWAAAVAAALLQRSGNTVAARRIGRLSPLFVRRLAAAALGANLVLAPAAHAAGPATAAAPAATAVPAATAPRAETAPQHGTDAGEDGDPGSVPDPGWRPERPATTLERVLGGTARDAAARDTDGAPREFVVRAGDSLWSVAARSLGEHATDAEIAREWPRWYRANRAAVGDNPDLLLVGTVLVRPAGTAEK